MSEYRRPSIATPSARTAVLGVGLVALLLPTAGCEQSAPAEFQANMLVMAEMEIPGESQQEIATILEAMFGTPDEPFVLPETGLDLARIAAASGPVWTEEGGEGHGLFRRHCAHCHGVTGNGMGPTALFLNPYPRDYRQGIFKFKSTATAAKPTRADLKRVLVQGINGTSMPSFRLLPDAEIEALVEYVVYLSMRGQTEIALAAEVFDLGEGEPLDTGRGLLVDDMLGSVVATWKEADSQVIDPEAAPPADRTAEQIARSEAAGQALFYGKAGCVKCHGAGALGDGQITDYDKWNEAVKKFDDSLTLPEPDGDDYAERLAWYQFKRQVADGLLAPRTILPRNLRVGNYRFGRRPLDIYRRVAAGIHGAPMPGVGAGAPGAQGALSSEQIWQVVDYVRSLPFQPESQPPKLPVALRRERL